MGTFKEAGLTITVSATDQVQEEKFDTLVNNLIRELAVAKSQYGQKVEEILKKYSPQLSVLPNKDIEVIVEKLKGYATGNDVWKAVMLGRGEINLQVFNSPLTAKSLTNIDQQNPQDFETLKNPKATIPVIAGNRVEDVPVKRILADKYLLKKVVDGKAGKILNTTEQSGERSYVPEYFECLGVELDKNYKDTILIRMQQSGDDTFKREPRKVFLRLRKVEITKLFNAIKKVLE